MVCKKDEVSRAIEGERSAKKTQLERNSLKQIAVNRLASYGSALMGGSGQSGSRSEKEEVPLALSLAGGRRVRQSTSQMMKAEREEERQRVSVGSPRTNEAVADSQSQWDVPASNIGGLLELALLWFQT